MISQNAAISSEYKGQNYLDHKEILKGDSTIRRYCKRLKLKLINDGKSN
jgi:phage host-nuclease inhibitor protein Gam